jgi:hypothetical protein
MIREANLSFCHSRGIRVWFHATGLSRLKIPLLLIVCRSMTRTIAV